jgi:hypothetical protein
MGDVIKKRAAIEDILSDLATTMARAHAAGGVWQALADTHLAEIAGLCESSRRRRQDAAARLVSNRADELEALDRAGRLVGKVADDIWNAIGRPARDPAMSVLFPGGISYYVKNHHDEQPQRLQLLADLLEADTHPNLDPTVAKTAADALRAEIAPLQAAQEAARQARAQARLAARTTVALARTGQRELSNLKRRYKAEGFSEAKIDTVIPERPRAPATDRR